jgi:glycosyltransferase involved in cell wall biosynthesis
MDTLYIVMPAYNEEANIEAVVKAWYAIFDQAVGRSMTEESRLVIADSGSSDRTHEILLSLQEKYPKLEIFTDCGRQHGPKCLALYRYAIEQGADYIFQTDSDGQTDPKEFPAFWAKRDKYDCVIGERKIRGDGFARKIVEKVVCLLVLLYFGVKVPDANAPFRLMKAEVVAKYIDRLPADYNIPNIMMTVYFAYYRESLVFKPISFAPRQGGTNSINFKKIIVIGFNALKDFAALKREM